MQKIIITEGQYGKLMREGFDEWMRKREEEQERERLEREYKNMPLEEKIDYLVEKKPIFENIRDIPNAIFTNAREVKFRHYREFCKAGSCETNVFHLVKSDPERYTIIAGFVVDYGSGIEHYWAYDKKYGGNFIEITPENKSIGFYVGVPLPHLNDDIMQADSQWDIEELKGGTVYEKYFKPYLNR